MSRNFALAVAALVMPGSAAAQQPTPAPADTAQIERLRQEDSAAYEAGDYEKALKASTLRLELVRRAHGPRSIEYAEALLDHAGNLNKLDRTSEAEPLFRTVLALRKELLGEKHASTIKSLNDLVLVVHRLGRLEEAEQLARNVLALRTEVLGESHADTIRSHYVLARNLQSQHRFADAEPLFRRALALRENALGEKHPLTIESLDLVAESLTTLSRHSEAEPLYRRALALNTEVLGEKHRTTINSIVSLAMNLEHLGRAAEAEPLYRRSLALTREVLGEKESFVVTILNSLSSILISLGRYSEAEIYGRAAVALSTEVLGEKHAQTGASLSSLAGTLLALGRPAEAEPLHRRALALRKELFGEQFFVTIESFGSLADTLDRLGRSDEAEPLRQRALALATREWGEKHLNTAVYTSDLARTLSSRDRHPEAEQLYRRALAVETEMLGQNHPRVLITSGGLAHNLLNQPSRASFALQPARSAAEGWRLLRRKSGASPRDEAQLSREVQREQWYFELLADAGWSAAQARPSELPLLRKEAFGALQDAMAGSATQAIAQMAARQAAEGAGQGLGALARERQSLSERWRANEKAQTRALAEGGENGRIQLQHIQKEQAALEAEMVRIDERLRKEAPQYYALIRPEPLELASAQQLLAPDEAALIVVPTDFGTHVMALTREGISWTQAELSEGEVEEAVTKIRAGLASVQWEPFMSGFDRATAHRLYRALIAPVAGTISGKRHLFVAAGGALASLPFGVLVTAPPDGSDDDPAALRSTRWFNDSHALIQLPSLQSLQFLRSFATRSKRRGGFTGFGDPLLEGNAIARGKSPARATSAAPLMTGHQTRDGVAIADVGQLRKLERIPGTAAELEEMRKALGAPASSVYLGSAATERNVRSANLSNSRIIAFATHGLVSGEIEGASEPGLVFTPPATASESDDGYLTASEITTLKLNADWIILSACNTAAGDGDGEPGLSGLARAFFYAGARTVLASHWPVLDEVAARLTVEAIALQRRNPKLSRAEALQAAMIAVRNSPDDATLAHPAAWAPFSLVGEGAR